MNFHVSSTGAEVDKGASWIHDAHSGHPIKQLANKFNLQTFATDYDGRQSLYNENGRDVFFTSQSKLGEVNEVLHVNNLAYSG